MRFLQECLEWHILGYQCKFLQSSQTFMCIRDRCRVSESRDDFCKESDYSFDIQLKANDKMVQNPEVSWTHKNGWRSCSDSTVPWQLANFPEFSGQLHISKRSATRVMAWKLSKWKIIIRNFLWKEKSQRKLQFKIHSVSDAIESHTTYVCESVLI